MNPLCFLTSAKNRSFKDVPERPGAYKLLAEGAPKFRSSPRSTASRCQNPTPPAAQPSLFEQTNPAVPAGELQASALAVEESNKAAAVPVAPAPAARPVSASPFAEAGAESKPARPGPVRQARGFCQKLWHQFFYGREGRPAHTTGVQPELALDRVTVLRNDLNEDDLEVVLVQRKVGRGEKPLARIRRMEMSGEAWNRLTAPFRKKPMESAVNPKAENLLQS